MSFIFTWLVWGRVTRGLQYPSIIFILEKLFLSRGSPESGGGEVLVIRGEISFFGSTAPRLSPPSLAYSDPQTSWPEQREVSRVDLAVFLPARHPWLPLPPAVRFVFFQEIILFLIHDLRTDNWMIHWVNADIFHVASCIISYQKGLFNLNLKI